MKKMRGAHLPLKRLVQHNALPHMLQPPLSDTLCLDGSHLRRFAKCRFVGGYAWDTQRAVGEGCAAPQTPLFSPLLCPLPRARDEGEDNPPKKIKKKKSAGAQNNEHSPRPNDGTFKLVFWERLLFSPKCRHVRFLVLSYVWVGREFPVK